MMFVFRNMLIKRAYLLEEIRRMALEAGWTEPRIETAPWASRGYGESLGAQALVEEGTHQQIRCTGH
jgi:hypothetical protein